MTIFKKKSLYLALAAGFGAVGVAGSASAVHVNPDGLGQVLIYPYYTVRTAATSIASGQYNTYISVTNSTNVAKAVKVRFLEGKNSREVLDFNLFLSPQDVWTGSIEPTSSGAHLVTADMSCTTGTIPASGQDFSNGAYTGSRTDGEDASLDRTREGYVEIIEMGTIYDGGVGSKSRDLLNAITHGTAGVDKGLPPCNSTVAATKLAALNVLSVADAAGLTMASGINGYLSFPEGGLFGSASLVNPSTGVDYTYDAVAIDNWTVGTTHGTSSTSLNPTIGGGSVVTSEVFNGGTIAVDTWGVTFPATATANGNAVSAAIMHDNVLNEFVLDSGTLSGTDWVVTFPTKSLYVQKDPVVSGVRVHSPTAYYPFNENFGLGGSCDTVILGQYDREEQYSSTSGGFSPNIVSNDLCWEANVITFNNSSILGSTNVKNTNVSWQNGWMQLGLNNGLYANGSNSRMIAADGTTYAGLPVVGFMVQDFVNSTLITGAGATPGAAFGGNFAHKYTRSILGGI